jgi:hypothetical protein
MSIETGDHTPQDWTPEEEADLRKILSEYPSESVNQQRVMLIGGNRCGRNRCGRNTLMLAQLLLSKNIDVVCVDDKNAEHEARATAAATIDRSKLEAVGLCDVLFTGRHDTFNVLALKAIEISAAPIACIEPYAKPWYNKFRPKRGRY